MIRSLLRRASMVLLAVPTALRVRRFTRTSPSFEDATRFLDTFRAPADCAIRISQRRSEIAALCELVRELRPRRVLEIGTEGGGTLFLFAQSAAEDAVLVSVDLPHPSGYRRHRGVIYRAFARPRQRVVPLRADSHDPQTRAAVEAIFAAQPVDFLFVDGDHSADGVARDYELYSPLVRPGGMIAFHDIVPGAREAVGGVPEFWQRVKAEADDGAAELVEDWDQGGLGIGVIRRSG